MMSCLFEKNYIFRHGLRVYKIQLQSYLKIRQKIQKSGKVQIKMAVIYRELFTGTESEDMEASVI